MPLHENEFEISMELVRSLLSRQLPSWADLPLREQPTTGTVNVLFRLGDDKVVRLPRTAEFATGPQREAFCLPMFGGGLPLRVPRHLALGTPSDTYPSHWSVLDWIDGETANATTIEDLDAAATALGQFVSALRRVTTDGAPKGGNYRAFGLVPMDRALNEWVGLLPDDIDPSPVLRVWDACLEVGEWTGPPTWLHGDLRGDNLLASGGTLTAVIDWESCTVGDPSADYLAAWWLFQGDSRDTFRSAAEAQPSDWMRAKGWALYMAVAAIPYYSETNPAFATQARAALTEILSDD